MTETTRRIAYEGPEHYAGLLAVMLGMEGALVDFEPPLEARDKSQFTVAVDMTARGMGAAITLAVQRFNQHMKGRAKARVADDH